MSAHYYPRAALYVARAQSKPDANQSDSERHAGLGPLSSHQQHCTLCSILGSVANDLYQQRVELRDQCNAHGEQSGSGHDILLCGNGNGHEQLGERVQQRGVDEPARAADTTDGVQDRRGQLSERQRQVWQMISSDMTTKEIALELGVCDKTVQYHRGKLMSQLGIHCVAGLTREAIRCGLVTL